MRSGREWRGSGRRCKLHRGTNARFPLKTELRKCSVLDSAQRLLFLFSSSCFHPKGDRAASWKLSRGTSFLRHQNTAAACCFSFSTFNAAAAAFGILQFSQFPISHTPSLAISTTSIKSRSFNELFIRWRNCIGVDKSPALRLWHK